MPITDFSTDYFIGYPPDRRSGATYPESMTGGTVSTRIPSNEADVNEHSFLALSTDQENVLFDNTGGDAVDHQLVVFAEPMHDLPEAGTTVGGLTIHEINCNHAIISGEGRLTGKKYTHVQTVISASNIEDGDDARIKRVEDNCLINELNSLNTALRVLSYFSTTETVKMKVNFSGDPEEFNVFTPGALWDYANPFDEAARGYIEKADITPTSILGYNWELVNDFDPQFVGNNFSNSVLITENTEWVVPDGVTHIKIILIGGGMGGQGGYDGQRGEGYNVSFGADIDFYINPASGIYEAYYPHQEPKQGGAAGNPGSAGEFRSFDTDTVPGTVLAFTIGAGGAGGAKNGGNGQLGGDTSVVIGQVTTISTRNAGKLENGYLYLIRNEIYGAPGAEGHQGGAGGATNTESLQGWQFANGLPGSDVGEWSGGAGGTGIRARWWNVGPEDKSYNEASGGGGGGAAWGANGKDTHYYTTLGVTYDNSPQFYNGSTYSITGAFGGDGADAVKPDTPLYGCGGGGGNGGGSGGNAGGGRVTNHFNEDPTVEPRVAPQEGGNPGSGSRGGDGGAGCAIIYY